MDKVLKKDFYRKKYSNNKIIQYLKFQNLKKNKHYLLLNLQIDFPKYNKAIKNHQKLELKQKTHCNRVVLV